MSEMSEMSEARKTKGSRGSGEIYVDPAKLIDFIVETADVGIPPTASVVFDIAMSEDCSEVVVRFAFDDADGSPIEWVDGPAWLAEKRR